MRQRRLAMLSALAFIALMVVGASGAADAQCDTPGCGRPLSDGPQPVTTDCLYILQAAVGLVICDPACFCDVNSSGGEPKSSDALLCLNAAAGLPGELVCPCPSPPPSAPCNQFEVVTTFGSTLDAGWNGAGHDAAIVEGASIFLLALRRCGGDGDPCIVNSDCSGETCDLTCDCDGADTECEVTGPAGDNRCLVNMQTTCEFDTDCPGSETCEKFFGPPLPLSAEGTPTCVTTYFQEDIAGTADTATGGIEVSAFLRSRVQLGIQLAKPCPRCGTLAQNPQVGDVFTCDGGPRNGATCTVGAVSPDFGGTSFDCPPDSQSNVSGVGLAINFASISTGTRSRDAIIPCGGSLAALHPDNGGGVCLDTFEACTTNADCLRCTGAPTTACASNGDCTGNGPCAAAPEQPISCGVYCHCGFCDGDPDAPCNADSDCDVGETCAQGSGASQQLQGNKCTDLTCGLGGAEQCCSNDDPSCANPTAKVGECTLQPFRSCNSNADCLSQNAGACTLFDRPCFENRIERTGSPAPLGSYCIDDPTVAQCCSNDDCTAGDCIEDASEPTTVALFCIPATASASINAAGGIPGPGAISFNAVVLSYRCGNNIQEGIEQCDDGNNVNGDGCDEICRSD
jgi:hypothetical protein